jgi:hypothetical protein
MLRTIEHGDAALPAGATDRDRLVAFVDGFAAFVARRRAPYLALVRGTAGGDTWVTVIHDETREELITRAIPYVQATGVAEDWLRLVLRGWLAMVEEVVLAWSGGDPRPREAIANYLVDALSALLAIGCPSDGKRAPTRR